PLRSHAAEHVMPCALGVLRVRRYDGHECGRGLVERDWPHAVVDLEEHARCGRQIGAAVSIAAADDVAVSVEDDRRELGGLQVAAGAVVLNLAFDRAAPGGLED